MRPASYACTALANSFDLTLGGEVELTTGGTAGIGGASGYWCFNSGCQQADNDGYYVQGSYTFNGKTKVAVSWGESNQDSSVESNGSFNDVTHEMWTVGVYHDVNSWLKLVAEYNNQSQDANTPAGAPVNSIDIDGFSVGGFIFW